MPQPKKPTRVNSVPIPLDTLILLVKMAEGNMPTGHPTAAEKVALDLAKKRAGIYARLS